jgi:hypothetical protein
VSARFWRHDYVKARKPHGCEFCLRTIGPGERYMRGKGFGDHVWSWAECGHCEAFRVLADVVDGWDEDYDRDTFACMEPRDEVERLWLAQWANQWRDDAGVLVAVPRQADLPGASA